MQASERGRYRVFDHPERRDALVFVDVESHDPVTVEADGYEGELADRVAALRPGYVVDATLEWADGTARAAAVDVDVRTLVAFADGVTGLFEAALDLMADARRDGDAVASRVTYSTDHEPNGALYAFADGPGARDVFVEFRSGVRPLSPLVERSGEAPDDPREVFVFRPADHDFVLVYVVLGKGSVLADTVRDTYDVPRPPEE